MKKIKVLAVMMAALALIGVYLTSAFALGDAFGALGEYFGISGGTTANSGNPIFNDDVTTAGNEQVDLNSGFRSILEGIVGDAVNRLTSSELMSVLNQVDINELLGGDAGAINEVLELIGAQNPTTEKKDDSQNSGQNNSQNNSQSNSQPSSQQNNAPQYTNVYVTEAPAATYSYSGATAAVTTTLFGAETTSAGETTSLSYIAPSTVYAEQITTLPFDYSVENEAEEKEGVTMKMVLGIAILLISAVAVVGVALSLKKSRV